MTEKLQVGDRVTVAKGAVFVENNRLDIADCYAESAWKWTANAVSGELAIVHGQHAGDSDVMATIGTADLTRVEPEFCVRAKDAPRCIDCLYADLGDKDFPCCTCLTDASRPAFVVRVPVDPYADVKAAHKAGKVIQGRNPDSPVANFREWFDIQNPSWSPDWEYRIKPDPAPTDTAEQLRLLAAWAQNWALKLDDCTHGTDGF